MTFIRDTINTVQMPNIFDILLVDSMRVNCFICDFGFSQRNLFSSTPDKVHKSETKLCCEIFALFIKIKLNIIYDLL